MTLPTDKVGHQDNLAKMKFQLEHGPPVDRPAALPLEKVADFYAGRGTCHSAAKGRPRLKVQCTRLDLRHYMRWPRPMTS